jgi:hypothetical protein
LNYRLFSSLSLVIAMLYRQIRAASVYYDNEAH